MVDKIAPPVGTVAPNRQFGGENWYEGFLSRLLPKQQGDPREVIRYTDEFTGKPTEGFDANKGKSGNDIFSQLMAFALPPVATVNRMYEGVMEGDPYSVAHNAFTFSPMIDDGITNVGGVANDLTDGALGRIVNVAGPTVGGIIGGIYGGPWGGVGGSMIGKQFAGRFNGLQERDIQQGTALTGAMGAATVGAGQLLGGLSGGISAGGETPLYPSTQAALDEATEAVVSSGGHPDAIPIIADMIDNANYNEALTAAAAASSSVEPALSPGGSQNAPTGTTDTIDDLMNQIETPSGTESPVDPIPTPEVEGAPSSLPSPDFSSTTLPDTGISSANIGQTLKGAANVAYKGLGYANKAKQIYDLYNSFTQSGEQSSIAPQMQTASTQQAQSNVIPTGATPMDFNFSNMPDDEAARRAWGRVLV